MAQESDPLVGVSYEKGEYLIHILLEQTRALRLPGQPDKTIDPLIKVDAFGIAKFSTQKKGAGQTSTTLWNEHLFFSKKFQDGRELQAEDIKFQILDHRLFGSNAVVGQYELDFSTVYMMENHVLLHKWLGLINPEKDFNQVTGFLKVSINVVGAKDKQQTLQLENDLQQRAKMDQAGSNNLFGDGDLLLPPHIQTKGQQLRITLIKADRLMKMDAMFGTIDPFVVFEVGGLSLRTVEISKNQNPVWETFMLLPVMSPCSSEYVSMKLFDYDMGAKDEVVGCQQFKITDIARGALTQPFWVNIYGANIDASQDQRAYLCSHPDLGTQWAGRVQLSLEIFDDENPKLCIEKVRDQQTLARIREEKYTMWEVHCEVYYALNCPKDDGTYSVKLTWGDYEVKTDSHKSTNGLCEFYKYLTLPHLKFPGGSSQDLPDIFLYLMDGDKPICFKRWKNLEVMSSNENKFGKEIVVTLIPDKSIKNTPIDQPGIIKLRLLTQQGGGQYKPQQLRKPKGQNQGRLYINLFQAENMLSSDMDGLADPIVDIIFYDLKVTTQLVNDTISPIWNQKLELATYTFDSDAIPPIIMRFFDQDKVSRDFMGQTLINFQHGLQKGFILENSDQIAEPKWMDILIYGQKAGRVLVSFNYNDKINLNLPKQITPKTTKHYLKIKLFGLRHLRSFGPVPVSKAFVKFDVSALRHYGDQNLLLKSNEIITQPKDAGRNPNIQSIIALDLMLPENDSFMPQLQGCVNDYIMKGLLQPLIGQFSIDLRAQKLQTLQNIQDKLIVAAKVLSNTAQLGDGVIHLMESDVNPKSKNSGMIKSQFEDDAIVDGGGDDTELLNKLGILQGTLLDVDKVVMYVQYNKNEDEGIFEEQQQFNSAYVPLGYDTQLQKANLYMIRQSRLGKQIPQQQNATSKARMNVEIKAQLKSDKLAQVAGDLLKKNQLAIDNNPGEQQIELTILDPMKGNATVTADQIKEEMSKKHYRLCLSGPLEKSVFMQKDTFDIFHIHKGISNPRETESMADLVFGVKDTHHLVGKVKGWVELISDADLQKLRMDPHAKFIPNELNFTSGKSTTSSTDKEIVIKSQVTIRVYVVDCFNLPPKDLDSMSDPYVKIKLGNEEVGSSDDHVNDDCNPKFFKMYSINTELPGASELIIKVFDYDDFLPDDLIGQTTIDLEERYYQTRFRQLKYVPVETRQLYHPSSSIPQGQIRLFVEIIPSKQATLLRNPWFIDQRPKAKFYLKVVVWDVYDVPAKDVEDTSDIYVVGYVEENHKQVTDTHYRSRNGKGSFNWRMIFPLELPQPETILSFQIFDKDIFSPDDFISDCSYDITNLAQKAFENEINIKMYSSKEPESDGILGGPSANLYRKTSKGTQYEKVEIPTENVCKDGYNVKQSGKIAISVELVPESVHLKNPSGLGRSQPNQSPFCPEPTGRIEWSWNPFKMLDQLLGPKAKCYLLLGVLVLFLIYMLWMFMPIISGNLIGNAISG